MSADDFQKDAQIVCSSPKDAAALCHFHHPVVVISRRGTRLNSWECSDVIDIDKKYRINRFMLCHCFFFSYLIILMVVFLIYKRQ